MKGLSILLLIFGLFVCAGAQNVSVDVEKSTIKGTVTDAGGAVIPGAKVSFTGKSGKIFSTSTNNKGFFRLEVNDDTYRVEFSGHGFATYKIEGYRVVSKTSMELDVALNVGGPSGPVRVEDPGQVLLTGTVYDPSGARISGVNITFKSENNTLFKTKTDNDGRYEISLSRGRYFIEFSSPGFKRTMFDNFRIVNAESGKIKHDVVMEVGSVVNAPIVVSDPPKKP